MHADEAAVNMNLWVHDDWPPKAPGAAGGLRIFHAAPPNNDAFAAYNAQDAAAATARRLEQVPATTVPYAANRVILFQSDLFHETVPGFGSGGLDAAPARHVSGGADAADDLIIGRVRHRRINLTFLWGERAEKTGGGGVHHQYG